MCQSAYIRCHAEDPLVKPGVCAAGGRGSSQPHSPQPPRDSLPLRRLRRLRPGMTVERAAALQFGARLSGTTHPSKANAEAFDGVVDKITHAARHLLASLHTSAPPRDRAVEAEKARARSRERLFQTPRWPARPMDSGLCDD
ncbi:DUF2277 domain-containing protein [Enterovirga aerilata]|uniref:DUF2277 domain-containing protein n=1 Tax=Enterovirga aerilata TaxID=2730920 RepID=A0A849ICC4_9HYPH|nr:DUF2277 domain-containing protein [Enterovirga sp. DB1703]NNM74921.1 DUF2277 domain-containing protein [Enterovirga sp. DB1703]